ncbi:glycosyltransferase family 2 protein [Kamptonema cortianum]|uniref:Glycosyltransferase family 2 protein n=1 Tax=Geitlerinema calcuttense NRMC-F 0142 TaxID=2922238 RepID=A0ABT7LYV3_9CYAN|nr:glycosyltransferase family 2 protein [Geitlerinema calcuttense]MDK3157450.1 glycosyltransferase family 2 protein [Kamptonema cortianum]MDL5056984.1 glycosyltransferase family 2 protein [Geitlerinema calcuttense NRMC-F 0142]
MNPLVSVIIPTYNYGHFLVEALESVFGCAFPRDRLEVIVIDDGSTDDPEIRVQPYRDRIHYIRQANAGKAVATQVGIEKATGKYLFNLDADDLFLPEKLERVVDIFEHNPDILHVAHPALYWDVTENRKFIEDVPQAILGKKHQGQFLLSYFYRRRILFGGGSTFAAKTDFLKSLKIPPQSGIFVDEYLALLTLSQGNSYFIEEPLSIYRIHGKNTTHVNVETDILRMKNQIACMEAILEDIQAQDITAEIKTLYALKTEVLKLAVKEQQNQKSLNDILSLWLALLKNANHFHPDYWRVIKRYTVLNRTLPTGLIKQLKQLKKR